VARTSLAILAIGACLLLMRDAARIGFSRLLTRYAVASSSLPAADQAVQLTPADPEAHRARATVLNRLRRPAEAEASLETATSLRSRDDYLWLELGNTREEMGDSEDALAAFDQAVRCAPYYAHTHWQRGNLLLRMGRYDEAFADLRQAASSNSKFLPNLLELAWGLANADVKKTETLIPLNSEANRLAFARFLASKGKGREVFEQVGLLTVPLSEENKAELTRLLFAAGDFGGKKREEIVNSGFEEPLLLNNSPLAWRVSRAQPKATLAIDIAERVSGQRSLQISFNGEWDDTSPLLDQTIVVEAGRHYRLKFFVKTKDLVTGGPPLIVLTDASNDQLLAKSDAFPSAGGSWAAMNVEFTTPSAAETVVIRLAREKCASSPCPIFGVAWLDDFSLEKL
jgi:tetratricopeptide (TPR) repeat protein